MAPLHQLISVLGVLATLPLLVSAKFDPFAPGNKVQPRTQTEMDAAYDRMDKRLSSGRGATAQDWRLLGRAQEWWLGQSSHKVQ